MANKELEQKIIAELSAPLAAEFERDAIEELARATGLRARDGRIEVATALWTAGYRLIKTTEIPWNGEGLPPAGTVCEYKHVHEWQKVEVFAVKPNYNGGHTALFTYENGCWCACAEPTLFRPFRTPEQIAAEEREQHQAAIMAELNRLWDADTKRSDFLQSVYALIVEAGAK